MKEFVVSLIFAHRDYERLFHPLWQAGIIFLVDTEERSAKTSEKVFKFVATKRRHEYHLEWLLREYHAAGVISAFRMDEGKEHTPPLSPQEKLHFTLAKALRELELADILVEEPGGDPADGVSDETIKALAQE